MGQAFTSWVEFKLDVGNSMEISLDIFGSSYGDLRSIMECLRIITMIPKLSVGPATNPLYHIAV